MPVISMSGHCEDEAFPRGGFVGRGLFNDLRFTWILSESGEGYLLGGGDGGDGGPGRQ